MARIAFDFTNLTDSVVGIDGLSDAELTGSTDNVLAGVAALRKRAAESAANFLHMPEIDLEPIVRVAQTLAGRFDTLVVIGIGGSSLGTRALWSALTRPHSRSLLDGSRRIGPRLVFCENTDPLELSDLLDSLDLSRTAFNVVTKSGVTIETMSSFFVARERLIRAFGLDGYRARMFATTDPAAGSLRAIVEADGLTALDVPPGVGGRFSALSAVGLFPLLAAGIDVAPLLEGARAMRDLALSDDLDRNIAARFAQVQLGLYGKGKTDVVLMPYAHSLFELSLWFVQLWAESLGKPLPSGGAVGPTPIPAIGTIDQHSQLQLFMEGPKTKNVVFIEVGSMRSDVSVPTVGALCPPLDHLSGKQFEAITHAELAGVREGLVDASRPNSTFAIDQVDAWTMGALMMVFECATAIAGTMFGINAFNQPGVELGKVYAHGILGRAGDEAKAAALLQRIAARVPRVAH